jgi:hypothetical protein
MLLPLTAAFLLSNPLPIRAQDADFWAFLGAGRVVTRCDASSAAAQQASQRLQRLDARVQALETSEPVTETVRDLHDVLRTECFLAASETDRAPQPDSVLSLKEWWMNGGGVGWLETFVKLPLLGPIENLKPHIAVPADVRKTLNLEAHREHPLTAILCPLTDTACGSETRGWKRRAEEFFEAHPVRALQIGSATLEPLPSEPAALSRHCTERTSGTDAQQRYQRWRDCVEAGRPKQMALPLGNFKPPRAGWLVIAGRRGHYEFCDTTRAYDLTTGAAFIDDSCSALVLKRGGSVDFDATDSARAGRVSVGRISVENLREAVWMLLLRGEAEEVQLETAYYPLPPGVTPRLHARPDDNAFVLGAVGFSTGQSSLTWRWIPDDAPSFVGEVTWPDSYDAADGHASSLLAIAEAGFLEGCAPRQLPSVSTLTPPQARNLNEVRDGEIKSLNRDLQHAVERWRTLPACSADRR